MAQTKKGHDPAERDDHGRFKSGHKALWVAPEGNDFACKYKEEYCEAIVEYFLNPPVETYIDDEGNEKPGHKRVYPTIQGFATSIGVIDTTVVAWAEKYDRFRSAYMFARNIQLDMLVRNGLNGTYNPTFAKFVASTTHGMVEKTAVDVGNEGAKPFEVNIKVVD